MIERAAGREPLAALLFGEGRRPVVAGLDVLSAEASGFSVINKANAASGCAELLHEGLTFDVTGLAPAPPLPVPDAVHRVALPTEFVVAGHDAAWLAVGPHLASAQHLLPIIRGAANILCHLTVLEGLAAIVWRPARIVMSPAWFAEAVGIWLAGGPFPALALTALARTDRGLSSEGLTFLMGQDFTLEAKDGAPSREDSRIAVRLTDWLVAHGRVDTPREVVLAGAGAVWLEPVTPNSLNVRVR